MRFDYPNLEAINAAARRDRAAAVHALVVAPLARFWASLKVQPKPRRSRWIAVHHGS